SLLAKAIVQAMSFCGLHWPLREQAPTGLRPVHQLRAASPVQHELPDKAHGVFFA
ncbi:hypothetical protein ACVKXK_004757, partial [Pseudomonas sp. PvP101]